ncbi:ArsI/CadI family heavy metal resistance metalloenzyme [Dyella sp.]|jgi:hypothetical protein|uniref:ArsI/CadI family heavy metal resistance metalloenzyme n=1 Tax=Dyella sp. TaxID=1869338 RepID=UPI002CE5F553|nr:ArsI/CadI family heavy metal resistance metalloenzyme [Dyella sp.]HTC27209.1 ArsI/CadI family heavy metal resistance metalloenzyme [Dyella sp.]
MNRFHVHLNVVDLPTSVQFYTRLFAAEPTVLKADYAKWMLDDPRVNFAISNISRVSGIDHLGIQVESEADLIGLGTRLTAAGGTVTPEVGAICCYAQSDKVWIEDPQGTRWETFYTFGEAETHYANLAACGTTGASCAPAVSAQEVTSSESRSCCAAQSGCC